MTEIFSTICLDYQCQTSCREKLKNLPVFCKWHNSIKFLFSTTIWRKFFTKISVPIIRALRIRNLNSTSNTPVAPCRLSCHISANQREAETSANVNKHWKTRAKGNDVITKVISANQHFASTFSMQISKFQRRSYKLFLSPAPPPERSGDARRLMLRSFSRGFKQRRRQQKREEQKNK